MNKTTFKFYNKNTYIRFVNFIVCKLYFKKEIIKKILTNSFVFIFYKIISPESLIDLPQRSQHKPKTDDDADRLHSHQHILSLVARAGVQALISLEKILFGGLLEEIDYI